MDLIDEVVPGGRMGMEDGEDIKEGSPVGVPDGIRDGEEDGSNRDVFSYSD